MLSSVLLASPDAWGQIHKSGAQLPSTQDKEEKTPLYQGLSVGVEIAGLGSYLLGSDILSSEIAIQANLKNRFMPILEVGYGKADAINEGNDLHYKTSSPYFRIGLQRILQKDPPAWIPICRPALRYDLFFIRC